MQHCSNIKLSLGHISPLFSVTTLSPRGVPLSIIHNYKGCVRVSVNLPHPATSFDLNAPSQCNDTELNI